MSKNNHPFGYEKKLVSSCDDEVFMSGDIIISWRQKDEDKTEMLRVCRIEFDLQRGNKAVLRYEEVKELIKNLETVRDRLKP